MGEGSVALIYPILADDIDIILWIVNGYIPMSGSLLWVG